jgi:hypothetical protein
MGYARGIRATAVTAGDVPRAQTHTGPGGATSVPRPHSGVRIARPDAVKVASAPENRFEELYPTQRLIRGDGAVPTSVARVGRLPYPGPHRSGRGGCPHPALPSVAIAVLSSWLDFERSARSPLSG